MVLVNKRERQTSGGGVGVEVGAGGGGGGGRGAARRHVPGKQLRSLKCREATPQPLIQTACGIVVTLEKKKPQKTSS